MKFSVGTIVLIFFFFASVAAQAQRNELAGEGSGFFAASPYEADWGGGFQINYAHRLASVPLLSLYGEVPFVAGFNNTRFLLGSLGSEKYDNYYLTPGLKLKFAPGFIVSPYVAAGIGWAHFSSRQSSATDNLFAADWGGGLDFKVFPYISLRLEARDFYSSVPSLALPSLGGHQNNIAVSAGLVLRF